MKNNHQVVVLTNFLRYGDTVKHVLSDQDRQYGTYGKVPMPESIGVVVGFYETKISRGRIEYGRKPGIYHGNGAPRVYFPEEDRVYHLAGRNLILQGEEGLLQQRDDEYRIHQKSQQYMIECVFCKELPDTPYWEYDFVSLSQKTMLAWRLNENECICMISSIDYLAEGSIRYEINLPSGGAIRITGEDIDGLSRRGRVWNHYHDIPNVFESLDDEATFNAVLGLRTQVWCDAAEGYHWSLEAILPALNEGKIDIIMSSGNPFGGLFDSNTFTGWKFTNEDLGNRLRQKCIEGFSTEKEPV